MLGPAKGSLPAATSRAAACTKSRSAIPIRFRARAAAVDARAPPAVPG